jgi:carboxynorspermidine decarboxylase
VLATVEHVEAALGDFLQDLEWVNLGGGYLFEGSKNIDALIEAVEILESRYGLQVFIEPGAAFVRAAGFIVSSILDIFYSGGKRVAVLDTTVNHMPEVFEYQFEPDVLGHDDRAAYEYVLAGSTCLSGDLFGEYGFSRPCEVGDKLVFYNAGAYTLSKAHTFNGVNLPAIYELTDKGDLVLKARSPYTDFAARWGKRDSVVPV